MRCVKKLCNIGNTLAHLANLKRDVMKINPPFRAEHIGSLLRPQSLKDAWKNYDSETITELEYGTVIDNAVRDAVCLQEQVGLRVITDGEFRRKSYWSHFLEAVDGFGVRPSDFRFRDDSGHTQEFLAPCVESKVRWTKSIAGCAFEFLRSVTTKTAKLTIPSPPTMHFWCGRDTFSSDVYDNEELFFDDLSNLFKEEIKDLVARGCTYLQIDDVPLAMLCDENVRSRVAARGNDPDELTKRYVRLINESIPDLPMGITIGLHLCRGNLRGSWLSEGGYESIASLIFNKIHADVFFLEYDDERSGGFEPLRYLPSDKTAVLGLMTTKSPALERVDDIRRKVDKAVCYAPLDNLAISPQCGFSSTVSGNPLTTDDQWRKLEFLTEVAEAIWGEN